MHEQGTDESNYHGQGTGEASRQRRIQDSATIRGHGSNEFPSPPAMMPSGGLDVDISRPRHHSSPNELSSRSEREQHKRSWSGGIIFAGVENMLATMTPPLFQRKRSVEEDTQEFHIKNQRFLRQAERVKEQHQGSFSPRPQHIPVFRSPSRTRERLPSIDDNDDSDEEADSAKETSRPPTPPLLGEKIEPESTTWDDETASHAIDNDSFVYESDYSNEAVHKIPPLGMPEYNTGLRMRDEESREDLDKNLDRIQERQNTKPKDKEEFVNDYMRQLEKEREALIAKWKSEFEAEQQAQAFATNRGSERLEKMKKDLLQPCFDASFGFLSYAEVFISNLPMTIGALGLAWATMGVVWFKFMEENVSSCIPVHFNSPLCTFPEFPGCFHCDESTEPYRVAFYFHQACSAVAGILAMMFLSKVVLAWRVVADELSNPTTATPCGVACMTLVCVFGGRGWIGADIVFIVSCFHLVFAFWFLYMAIFKFRILPDPSWSPCTMGLSYAAIKIWLYFPLAGKVLLVLCTLFFLGTFFISVIRVALNKKISAPVCWIQLSGPSITMYAMTILAQPSREHELLLEANPDLNYQYHEARQMYYLPLQHCMMVLSLIGVASGVHSLWTRWDIFRLVEFSPAHVAFIFPTLSHTNAIQAYRATVNAFSTIPNGSPFKVALYSYWVFCLLVSTVLNLIFTYKFVTRLPTWTKIDVMGETAPPSPSETILSEMMDGAHEIVNQPFVSPAVLQANETGTLIRTRRGTADWDLYGPYVRTRRVSALGFDPTMSEVDLRRERAELLDWVAKNAPRTRNRTLSVPIIMNLKHKNGHGIYGTFDSGQGRGHMRSQTLNDAPWA